MGKVSLKGFGKDYTKVLIKLLPLLSVNIGDARSKRRNQYVSGKNT
jgi:hypothetical protein